MEPGTEVLREVLRTVPMAAALFDRELRYLAYNDQWLTLHDEARGELIGRTHAEAFPVHGDEWGELARRCLRTPAIERHITCFERVPGRREHRRWVMAPWRRSGEPAEASAIGGLVIYGECITEQVKIEQRLAERESLVRDLFDKSPVGLNLCRMDGLWIESNPAFLDIIGYSQEEADGGLTYWQLTPRKYDADEAVALEQLQTHRRYGPYEKEFIRKDGRLVPVRLNGFLVAREGVEYIWSLIEDLTAQRELEGRLEQERLKAIQASKLAVLGEMAASIAHEINNPLAIVDAYAFALRDAIAKGDRAFANEALTAMRVAVARAGKIVHGLRKFARTSDGETEAVRIADLVDEALALCRARIQTHGVALDVEVATTAEVRGAPIELSQVLVNLLANAFDASQVAPSKWIRVRAVDVADAGTVELSVEDSGAGVPAAIADSIFQPFFTTKEVGIGTGLGLSISRSIVERHGGTLTLDRAAPHTRFVVVLPASTPASAPEGGA